VGPDIPHDSSSENNPKTPYYPAYDCSDPFVMDSRCRIGASNLSAFVKLARTYASDRSISVCEGSKQNLPLIQPNFTAVELIATRSDPLVTNAFFPPHSPSLPQLM
jgi:hypothetical protein